MFVFERKCSLPVLAVLLKSSLVHCNGGLIHCSVDGAIINNGPILLSGQSDTSRSHSRSGPYSVSSANPLPLSAPIQTAYESEESGHALQLTEEEKEVFEASKSRTIVDFLHLARFGRFGIQFFSIIYFLIVTCVSHALFSGMPVMCTDPFMSLVIQATLTAGSQIKVI